jgi:hypothetical protein
MQTIQSQTFVWSWILNVEQSGSDLTYGIILGFAWGGTEKAKNTSIVMPGVFDTDNLRGMAPAGCQT